MDLTVNIKTVAKLQKGTDMNKLFTPVTLGNVTLKNPIVFAPTSVGREGLDFYEKIAQGGTSLIVLPDVSVVPSMLGAPSLDSMKFADYFRKVLEICHRYGCKVAVQLFHPEYDVAYIGSLYRQRDKISSDEVHRLLAENMMTYADNLTTQQADEIIEKFVTAARNAQEIGLDMIQIHGDRLVGSFSSALFNHRTDKYAPHTAYAEALVKAVRAAVPEMTLDYKLTIRTESPRLGRGGALLEEVPEFVRVLEVAGVDSFHVAIANHSNIRDTIPAFNHPDLKGEGCFNHLGRAVLSCATKPVCIVGKLQHADAMEKLLEEGFACVGMSRQLVADPYWPLKVSEGRENEILYCTYCNAKCVASIMTGQPVSCVQWGRAPKESSKEEK